MTYPEFIPQAGACLITLNAYEGRGAVRWMVREVSQSPVDNGWRIMSAIDTSEYMNNSANWRITDFNEVCAIVPELIGIWDMPVGSDLQVVRDDERTRIVDTPTGREITAEYLYVPPDQRT